jgi:hypothetical protein
MTLRDLSKRQLYNLRRKSEKLRKIWWTVPHTNIRPTVFDWHKASWEAGFNAGLKAGLEIKTDVVSS